MEEEYHQAGKEGVLMQATRKIYLAVYDIYTPDPDGTYKELVVPDAKIAIVADSISEAASMVPEAKKIVCMGVCIIVDAKPKKEGTESGAAKTDNI
jgi:hypothetical protein